MVDLIELAQEKSTDEIRELADNINLVSDEKRDRLKSLIKQASDQQQAEAIDVNPAIADLINALDLPAPAAFGVGMGEEEAQEEAQEDVEIEGQPIPSDVQDAVDDILRVTKGPGWGLSEWRDLRGALESGNASEAPAAVQANLREVIDNEAAREELLDRTKQAISQAKKAQDLTVEDFPQVQQATERASGRTVADYWQPLLQELKSGDPAEADILRSQGVPEEQIELLFSSQAVLNQFIDKVGQNIADLRQQRQGAGGPPSIQGAVEEAQEERQGPPPEQRGLTDFQQRFVELVRDMGWCDVFPCRSPDKYFEASMARRNREFQFSQPQGFINFWFLEEMITKNELRERGFSDDVIDGLPG